MEGEKGKEGEKRNGIGREGERREWREGRVGGDVTLNGA